MWLLRGHELHNSTIADCCTQSTKPAAKTVICDHCADLCLVRHVSYYADTINYV